MPRKLKEIHLCVKHTDESIIVFEDVVDHDFCNNGYAFIKCKYSGYVFAVEPDEMLRIVYEETE